MNGKSRKGIAYSVIVIVAMLGVLMLTVWSYTELSTGAKYRGTVSGLNPKDVAITKLEMTKRFLTQDLTFSSQDSALVIAASGGTSGGATYWYCNRNPVPPEKEEVLYALSNLTLKNMNAYVEGLKEGEIKKQSIAVNKYGCCGIIDPGQLDCLPKDSSKCEYFQSTATQGGSITITDPEYVTDTGDLFSDNNADRFFWMYYKLYKDTKANTPMNIITADILANCRGPQTMDAKVKAAIGKLCDHYTKDVFDKYVECSYEINCLSTSSPISCLNEPCDVKEKTPQLCFKLQSVAGLDSDLSKLVAGGVVKAQGGSIAGVKFKIKLTDTKFNIPSSKGLQPLVWNLWFVMDIAPQECRPIDLTSS
jgi:hypothetical protein